MNSESRLAVYGAPLPDLVPDLATVPTGAVQVSPQVPESVALEDVACASLAGLVMAAPPGTVERRYALALGLRALTPGAPLTVMAPKEKGGHRIAKELEAFGCSVEATSRRHQRICQTTRPGTVDPDAAINAAIAAGAPRFVDAIGLWSQPGIFSWDRIDSGTALLLSVLPAFKGVGIDMGCGLGVIARAVLANPNVTQLALVDIDRRAIEAARRNVEDSRATFHWSDVRALAGLTGVDFVVMNPPFHDGGQEDRALGQIFIQQSHRALRNGGRAWLVANRHLPYEAVLSAAFSSVALRVEQDGFKVYEATK